MSKNKIFTNLWARSIFLALVISLLVLQPVFADVAPPEPPPGVIISPGQVQTQVRMVSELVTLTILEKPSQAKGEAQTEATFLMRNLGAADEQMDVRFPLVFGESAYYREQFPEIENIRVTVDGKSVATTRQMLDTEFGANLPWAVFPVKFPAGKDVILAVSYTSLGFGYDPFVAFRYILNTGAGWNGTIGSGDIVVRLPYQASLENVLVDETTSFSLTSGTPTFSGNEARWHFEDLEPTFENDFEVSLVVPAYWRKVLNERDLTAKAPNDGEAWGRLGKALKEVIRYPRGYLRSDPIGQELYREAVRAYEKSITLLPEDSLWHYGYADLLWGHYLYDVYYAGTQDTPELVRIFELLHRSLEIDPNNQLARDLIVSISYDFSWAVVQKDGRYDFLILTTTPTTAPQVPTVTPVADVTSTPLPILPTPTLIAAPENTAPVPTAAPQPTPVPVAGNPLCGGSALLLLGLLWAFTRRK